MLWGENFGINSTTIQANASMRSIVRKDSGKSWQDYAKKLAKKAGLDEPIDAKLRQFDRNRGDKKAINDDLESPSAPAGTTRLAYKAEHAVDLNSDLIVSATVQGVATDTATMIDTAIDAAVNLDDAGIDNEVQTIVSGRGYHSNKVMTFAEELHFKTGESERDPSAKRRWRDKAERSRTLFTTTVDAPRATRESISSESAVIWSSDHSPTSAKQAGDGGPGIAGAKT